MPLLERIDLCNQMKPIVMCKPSEPHINGLTYGTADAIIKTMMPNSEKEKIVELAKKYKTSKILLFGSAALNYENARDVDLAVEGINPAQFFALYAELIAVLSKPVDLIDITQAARFCDLIRNKAIVLYG